MEFLNVARVRVSVIVPLFNKEPSVTRALDSICSQTYADLEVIVVDDGSTDQSPAKVREYRDSRVRLVTQANGGPGSARNRGITEAQGDVLAFLDADDEWFPGYLESGLGMISAGGNALSAVTSSYTESDQDDSIQKMWLKRGLGDGIQKVTSASSALNLVYMLAFMSPCTTIARADVVRRWGGFFADGGCRYGEDAMLWLKVLLNETVAFNMKPLACFHREASGLSMRNRPRSIEPFLISPEDVESVCPVALRPLLRDFYALRACKTASILGYWGDSDQARALLRAFVSLHDWRAPYFATALVGCTPIGGILGRIDSVLRGARRAG
jgi:hypothetical protein